jgi:hypothetical protein
MNNNLTNGDSAPNDEQSLVDALDNEQLHRVFMVCPDAHEHIEIANDGQIAFANNFLSHLNERLEDQPIYFHDDNPLHYHRFSKPGNVMLTFLLPPEKIICVDGRLSLRKNNVALESILGAYLFSDSEKFYPHADFNPQTVSQRVN